MLGTQTPLDLAMLSLWQVSRWDKLKDKEAGVLTVTVKVRSEQRFEEQYGGGDRHSRLRDSDRQGSGSRDCLVVSRDSQAEHPTSQSMEHLNPAERSCSGGLGATCRPPEAGEYASIAMELRTDEDKGTAMCPGTEGSLGPTQDNAPVPLMVLSLEKKYTVGWITAAKKPRSQRLVFVTPYLIWQKCLGEVARVR